MLHFFSQALGMNRIYTLHCFVIKYIRFALAYLWAIVYGQKIPTGPIIPPCGKPAFVGRKGAIRLCLDTLYSLSGVGFYQPGRSFAYPVLSVVNTAEIRRPFTVLFRLERGARQTRASEAVGFIQAALSYCLDSSIFPDRVISGPFVVSLPPPGKICFSTSRRG